MIGYPFDSHVTFDSDGSPIYDRAISSIPERTLFKQFFTTGVLMKKSTNLQVVEKSGMTVTVKSGFALIEGCRKYEEADRTLVLQAASSTYDRIDTVVMRLNDNDNVRACDLYIVQGTPASNPVRPALTRTASIYEIGLADIFVQKNSTTISANKITDTRLEAERCGIVSAVSKIDTTTLFNQYHEEFAAWFDSIKDILDTETAGHLQLEIEALQNSFEALDQKHTTDVNEIKNKLTDICITREFEFDAGTITVGNSYTADQESLGQNCEVPGYVPLGIVGIKVTGSGGTAIVPSMYYIKDQKYVWLRVRNAHATTSSTVKITAIVLYLRA